MGQHATVTLTPEGGPAVEIDVGIAPLIEALWARGIATVASCEDGGTSAEGGLPAGLAWIGFPDEDHAGRFCELAREAVLGAFPLDREIRARAEQGGIPAGSWLAAFPAAETAHITELARDGSVTIAASPSLTPDHERTMGRNDRCWCESGKKFKKCHGR